MIHSLDILKIWNVLLIDLKKFQIGILEQNCDIVKIKNNIIDLYDLFTKKCCLEFITLNKHY